MSTGERWEAVGQYVDEGVSGNARKLYCFHRLLEDAGDGKVNVLICQDLSRLTRGVVEEFSKLMDAIAAKQFNVMVPKVENRKQTGWERCDVVLFIKDHQRIRDACQAFLAKKVTA